MTNSKEPKPTVISDKSLIPISFALLLLGGALRVEGINSKADALSTKAETNAREIETLKKEDKEIKEALTKAIIENNTRLARIEGAMGIKQ